MNTSHPGSPWTRPEVIHLIESSKAARSDASPAPAREQVESSARYTPPAGPQVRTRPGWHKVVGALQIVAGVALVVLHYGLGVQVLPGGHNDGWLVFGILVAAGGTWWLGLFDRPAGRW